MTRRLWLCLLLVLLVAGCTPSRAPGGAPSQAVPQAAPAARVRISVDADGVYEITAQALSALGFDLNAAVAEGLSLTTGGRPVAYTIAGSGQNQALRFYGAGLGATAYLATNVYWLSRGGSSLVAAGAPVALTPTPQIATRTAAPAAAGGADTTVVTATAHLEQQHQYQPKVAPGADAWFWQSLAAPASMQVKADLASATSGAGQVRVRVWANSTASVTPNHHLKLQLNGTVIGEDRWGGLSEHVITATVPAGVLVPSANTLTLTAPGDTGAPADVVLLDWVDIDYERTLAASGEGLSFAGAAQTFLVQAGAPVAALWDLTDPMRPVGLTDFVQSGGTVRFSSDGTYRRFALVTQAGLRRPAAITAAASAPDLAGWPGGADLIIITVPDFHQALKPLVAARQAQGLRVAVVDVGDIYDAYGAGRAGPEPIRAFLAAARERWAAPAPRYVLLAGDASYDPRRYLQGAEADLVPTRIVASQFSGLTASDVWYALPAGGADQPIQGGPQLAIGRLPAQTAEQLGAMVSKTLAYETGDRSGAWRQQALLLADNSDPSFELDAQDFAGRLTGMQARTLTWSGDGKQTHADLLAALNDGVGLVGYFGHGSLRLWGKEQIFGVDDVPALKNSSRLPVVFTFTCLSGFFQHPQQASLAEALLRAPQGGAVAALAPSSAGLSDDQHVLAVALTDALAGQPPAAGRRLGDLVQAAQTTVAGKPGLTETLLTFNLLGDPTLSY